LKFICVCLGFFWWQICVFFPESPSGSTGYAIIAPLVSQSVRTAK